MTRVTPSVPLATFSTFHVQGIAFAGSTLFVSTIDQLGRSGYLLKIAINGAEAVLIDAVALADGEKIHPGGITRDGDRILAPLAQQGNRGDSIVLSVEVETLAVTRLFSVPTHIGAIADDGAGRLFGADYDTSNLFAWSTEGKELFVQPNPTQIAYQDMEWYNGRLYCSGVDKGDRSQGRVDVYSVDLGASGFTLERSTQLPSLDRHTNLGREGMTIWNDTLYFLPEDDARSRLYTLDIQP